MLCEHLCEIEKAITLAGIAETYRGQPWSKNCRQWVYFDCVLDMDAIKRKFDLAECVGEHLNHDPKSGREAGLVCNLCHDAVVGLHAKDGNGKNRFPTANL